MNREELVHKLELVSRALADNNLVPIFQCFVFNGKAVLAFNDTLGVEVDCPTEKPFAVSGKILLELLRNSTGDEVTFKITGHDLVVNVGKSNFKLPFFDESHFLFTKPKFVKTDTVVVLSEAMLNGFNACLLTTSSSDDQRAFMGVYLNQQGRTVNLYSTDGDAISRYRLDIEAGSKSNYMIHKAFCSALIQTAKETESSRGGLDLSSEWAVASLDSGYTLYGRMIELDAPTDHEAEIKATLKGPVTVCPIPQELDKALSRARVLADPESAKTVLTVEGKSLRLLTETSMGVVRDVVPFGAHAAVSANVSAEFMQRCIGLCDQMAIFERVCCFSRADKTLFILAGNLGDQP